LNNDDDSGDIFSAHSVNDPGINQKVNCRIIAHDFEQELEKRKKSQSLMKNTRMINMIRERTSFFYFILLFFYGGVNFFTFFRRRPMHLLINEFINSFQRLVMSHSL